MHLNTLQERLTSPNTNVMEILYREWFTNSLISANLPKDSVGLSVSVGDGIWDYLALSHTKTIKKIVATDIVDNPVSPEDIEFIKKHGEWEFTKVSPESTLPFSDNTFDVAFHHDVLEHVEKPYLFLLEQFRVLKSGGTLLVGTPNLFRPGNILRMVKGQLTFPVKIGENEELGDYIHIQEFYEQQLMVLLKEVGFKNVVVTPTYFGFHPLGIHVSNYPKAGFARTFAHILLVTATK